MYTCYFGVYHFEIFESHSPYLSISFVDDSSDPLLTVLDDIDFLKVILMYKKYSID